MSLALSEARFITQKDIYLDEQESILLMKAGETVLESTVMKLRKFGILPKGELFQLNLITL